MNTDPIAREMAQQGLHQIEHAIIKILECNPRGLRNSEIANLLDLRSDFRGKQQDYLTYSVLGGLLKQKKIARNDNTKVYTKNIVLKAEGVESEKV